MVWTAKYRLIIINVLKNRMNCEMVMCLKVFIFLNNSIEYMDQLNLMFAKNSHKNTRPHIVEVRASGIWVFIFTCRYENGVICNLVIAHTTHSTNIHVLKKNNNYKGFFTLSSYYVPRSFFLHQILVTATHYSALYSADKLKKSTITLFLILWWKNRACYPTHITHFFLMSYEK